MTDDRDSYRVEPNAEFADRLERALLRRLAAPAGSSIDGWRDRDPTEIDLEDSVDRVDGLDGRRVEVTFLDTEVTPIEPHRQRRWRSVAAAAAVAGIVFGGLVLAARDDHASETQVPSAPAATAVADTPATSTSSIASGEEPTEVTVPAVRDWLVQRADQVVFVAGSPAPAYWRLGALNGFDGTRWSLLEASLSAANGPLAPGFEPGVDGETLTQTFEITGLDGPWLPAAYSPVRFDGVDGVSFNARDSSLVAVPGTSTIGLEYSVDSLMPRYDPAILRAANAAPTGLRADEHLALPDDFPAELAELARSVTAGATTRYDQAIALQSWFRGFDYDQSFSAGTSQDAMVEFVAERRGYCEQFAGTFAVLARVLGLPSRVAIGFTPGEQTADGRYHVRGEHAHAWPEVYFEGVGWVPFEPTPGRGIPAAEPYTGVPATQTDVGGSPITPTSAPP